MKNVVILCLLALLAINADAYYLLYNCGAEAQLNLNTTQAQNACNLLDFWSAYHVSDEGPGINRAAFNATVDPNMIYLFDIGFNAVGIEAAWQLYSTVIAVQAQPLINFAASVAYGVVTAYNESAGTVDGRVAFFVYAQINFTQRFDVGLYGVCPNGAVFHTKYQVDAKLCANKMCMERVSFRPESMAWAAGINARSYMNNLALYSDMNPDWVYAWENPTLDAGYPSRPLSSPSPCKYYNNAW